MKSILQLLGNLKEYIVYSFIVLISLILIFQNENIQVRFLRVAAVSVIGLVQNTFSVIPNVFQLEKENKSLREINNTLSNEVSQYKEAKLENLRLSQMLAFKERTKYRMVSAKIIGKTLIQARNTITLDIGESDSVKIGMPVITEKGLIGKIVAASYNYSIAQILLNKDLKISSKDQRSRIDGILSWDGEKDLLMKNVSKSADVQLGDPIITSEYSNNFPPGIPIGKVIAVGTLDNLFKNIQVESFVDFEKLEEVFVVIYLSSDERQQLEKRFQIK